MCEVRPETRGGGSASLPPDTDEGRGGVGLSDQAPRPGSACGELRKRNVVRQAGCRELRQAGCRELRQAGCRYLRQAGCRELGQVGCRELRQAGCRELRQAGCRELGQAGCR